VQGELKIARDRLTAVDGVVIVTHERPDGDAVGSLLALSLSLQRLGKHPLSIMDGGVPERYAWLPGADSVLPSWPAVPAPVIAVDCADQERLAPRLPAGWGQPVLNIDHHATNTRFGVVNLVDSAATATAEVIYDLTSDLGLSMDSDIATNLLAGIVTDTIGFRTDNVTGGALRKVAELVERGGRLPEVYERLLTVRPLAAARYWGAGLARLHHQGDIVWTHLSLSDRTAAGYPGDDDADLVNFMATIDEGRVAVLFVEQGGGKVKISWRTHAGIDVSRVAQQFGGGGHEPAAGASVEGRLEDVEKTVLAATAQAIMAGVHAP
jgi:bifunctional oligoribonuclease and PAP phosphatase NrnA